MKRFTVAMMLMASIAFSGCIGPFTVTNKIAHWNMNATGDKNVNTAIMWVLGIVPIYEGAFVLDLAVFNVIEFWSGKNPMAFTGPETLEKVVSADGSAAKITMGKGVLAIDYTAGPDSGKCTVLRFNREDKYFYLSGPDGTPERKIGSISMEHESTLNLYFPNGAVISRTFYAKKSVPEDSRLAKDR